MCCNNNWRMGNNCWWWIINLNLLFCNCGGNNGGNWNNCGCDNDCRNSCC